MFTRVSNIKPPSQKTIIFTGGINESLSNLEMKAGECFDLVNYEEISGEFHGYRSVMGYERIDGTTVNIEDPNNPGEFIDVSYPSDVPIVFNDPDDLTDITDTARESRRSAIVTPTLTGGGYLKGSFDFHGEEFVIAYENANGDHLLFRRTDNGGTGWEEIVSFPTITEGSGVDAGINYHIAIGRFELYPLVTDSATPNTDVAILCNGVSPAIIVYQKDDGTFACVSLVESNGPEYEGSDFLPVSDYPLRSVVYNQRLHIAYPYGTLFVSHVGDPFQFNSAVKSAGVWWLGSDVTDFVVGPSSLAVFMEEGIDIIRPADPDLVTGFDEVKETFSPTSGAKPFSAQRILGRILFCDDRGITSLEATDRYGDFNAVNMSKRIMKTYERYKDIIAGTAVDRDKNQYIVYFTNGQGITLTVEPNYRGDFTVRGTTRFNLGLNINTVWGVRKESERLLTSRDDAYLRKQHKDAQSFDGEVISSKFTSAFHSYGSPTNWKTFQRVLFELSATKGQFFSFRPIFNYQRIDTPKANIYTTDPTPASGIWGEGDWGEFVWGGTGAVNQEYLYMMGIGFNMSLQFSCSSKYHNPHVVHNAIVLYTTGGIRY